MKKFNLGFECSKTDVCSECVRLQTELKSGLKTPEEKGIIAVDYRLRKARAKRFYQELKKWPEHASTTNFDLMQNQPLSKIPISEAFYAYHVWYYIFAEVLHSETGNLNPNTVHFYRWQETDYGRGSNEIISCLNNFLNHVALPMITTGEVKKLSLFCDAPANQKLRHDNNAP